MEVARADVPKYGIIRPGDTPGAVAGLIEKPPLEEAPSRLASIERYVLEPEILDILAETPPGAGGEIQLADAINLRAQQGHVNAVPLSGARYDCGSKFGYLEAIVDFALDHAEYGPAFGALIAQRAGSKAA
jgi:UTP--glucose-1-phosphate uridylyltransferase